MEKRRKRRLLRERPDVYKRQRKTCYQFAVSVEGICFSVNGPELRDRNLSGAGGIVPVYASVLMTAGIHCLCRNSLEPAGAQVGLFRITVIHPLAVVVLLPSILRHTSLSKEVLLAADGFLGAHSLFAVGAEVEVVGRLGLVDLYKRQPMDKLFKDRCAESPAPVFL